MNNSIDKIKSGRLLRCQRSFACLTVTVCLNSDFAAAAFSKDKNALNPAEKSNAASKTHEKNKHEVDLKSMQCDDVLGSNAGITPIASNPARPTVALALGGGGVRGAAHIGVLRAFEKEHIPIDFIAGTSMGAIVGGLYAAGVSLDTIEEMFRDKHALKKACVPFPMPLQLSVRLPKRIVGLGSKPVAGLFSGDRLGQFIDANVPEECRKIENTKIKFAAVAADLLDGNTYAITGGDLGKGVQASCSIPLMYRPVCTSDGKILVDGGVKGNLPTWVAKCSKADIVITVNVNESVSPITEDQIKGIFDLLNRASNMVLSQSDTRQLEFGDLYVCPEMPDISLYSHKLSDARQAIDAGTIAAGKSMEKIKQLIESKSNKSARDEAQPLH